jgi:uncharacterized protein YutE (UPF0331/DUF86 family)
VDYGVRENLAERVYRTRIKDMAHLREIIVQKWEEISEDQIDRTIDEFRPRLKKVVEVEGKHIEQFFLVITSFY